MAKTTTVDVMFGRGKKSLSGFKSIEQSLKLLKNRYKQENTKPVIVGYFGVNYALFVHEINRNYNNGKQWKFLETPARENQDKYAATFRAALRREESIQGALTLAALALQRDSQEIVPVDTANLKGSAGVKIEQ